MALLWIDIVAVVVRWYVEVVDMVLFPKVVAVAVRVLRSVTGSVETVEPHMVACTVGTVGMVVVDTFEWDRS